MATRTISALGLGDYLTVAAAYAAALDGDTLRVVDSETYTEQFITAKVGLILEAGAACTPILEHLSGAGHAVVEVGTGCGLTIRGQDATGRLTIRQLTGARSCVLLATNAGNVSIEATLTAVTGAYVTAAFGQNGRISLLGCTSPDAMLCDHLLLGASLGTAELVIERCTGSLLDVVIKSNWWGGRYAQNAFVCGGIHNSIAFTGDFSRQTTFAENETVWNGLTASPAGCSDWGNRPDTVITDNSFYSAGIVGYAVVLRSASTVCRNNASVGFDYGIYSTVAKTTDHNCCFGANTANWGGLAAKGVGDLESDPQWVDAPNGDFTWPVGSPLYNAGTTSGEPVDYAGQPRVSGVTQDIGSREFPHPILQRLVALTDQTFRVRWDDAVKQDTPLADDDALYLANWTADRPDGVAIPYLLAVVPDASGDPRMVVLEFAAPPTDRYETLRVTTSGTIAAASGGFATAGSLTCLGVEPRIPALQAAQTEAGIRDLANPIFGAQAGQIPTDASGDHPLDTAAATVKKLVVRVLTTVYSGFAHLPGWGAAPTNIKGLLRSSDVQDFARRAKTQIQAIPGVQSVSVVASTMQPGVLFVRADVRTKLFGTLGVEWSSVKL